MIDVLYCKQCYSVLNEYGCVAKEKFCEICEYFLTYKEPMKIQTSYYSKNYGIVEIVKFLELKGYIVSLEIEEGIILVKPLGLCCICPNEDHCVCRICFDQQNHG